MHGPLQHRVWSFGVHEVEDAMDHLVAPDAENGRSQDALIAGIDQDFHESLSLALFDCPADLGHRPLRDECRLFPFPNLPFRHARTPQRGIDVQCDGEPTRYREWCDTVLSARVSAAKSRSWRIIRATACPITPFGAGHARS